MNPNKLKSRNDLEKEQELIERFFVEFKAKNIEVLDALVPKFKSYKSHILDYYEGMYWNLKDDYSAAETALRRAIERAPKFTQPQFALFEVYMRQGKCEVATTLLETLFARKWLTELDRYHCCAKLGELYRSKGRKRKAIAIFESVLATLNKSRLNNYLRIETWKNLHLSLAGSCAET